jgi:hypothetical protein
VYTAPVKDVFCAGSKYIILKGGNVKILDKERKK